MDFRWYSSACLRSSPTSSSILWPSVLGSSRRNWLCGCYRTIRKSIGGKLVLTVFLPVGVKPWLKNSTRKWNILFDGPSEVFTEDVLRIWSSYTLGFIDMLTYCLDFTSLLSDSLCNEFEKISGTALSKPADTLKLVELKVTSLFPVRWPSLVQCLNCCISKVQSDVQLIPLSSQ